MPVLSKTAEAPLTTPPPLALDHPEVLALTARFDTLKNTADRDAAESVRELGVLLIAVRDLLPRGSFAQWIEERPNFGRRAAYNYIALAQWSEAHPADFMRWKTLGPTKLYAIATLDWRGLELLRQDRLVLPDTGQPKSLAQMSLTELTAVIQSLQSTSSPPTPIHRITSSVRQRSSHLADAVAELARRRDEVDPARIAQTRADLQRALQLLDEAFPSP